MQRVNELLAVDQGVSNEVPIVDDTVIVQDKIVDHPVNCLFQPSLESFIGVFEKFCVRLQACPFNKLIETIERLDVLSLASKVFPLNEGSECPKHYGEHSRVLFSLGLLC